jgi:catechol 2,3-dioxygenase-like lactoylglutathione lyase family enzyme
MSDEFVADVEPLYNHVAIKVRDLDAAVAYYHGILGLPITRTLGPADNPRAIFVVGVQLVRQPADAPAPGPGVFDHVGIAVKNIEEVCARLERAGYHPDTPLNKRVYPELGNREQLMAFYRDPDGNRVELVHWLS